ncbi:MAG: KpsF/GutQ family sugar-phosphate isomerase [Gammaproteobacteria bacterium]
MVNTAAPKPSAATHADWIKTARTVFDIESEALLTVRDRLGDSFTAAIKLLLECQGKVVCVGVGKSGHIARKAAATLSSTGTPAFFMHPAEAGHGDMGALASGDVLLALSYSGESREVLDLLPALRRLDARLIAIVGANNSTLARTADVALLAPVEREACPHNLAPTASTTAALALTDALALTLLSARGFSADDFARAHPSGMLGRRLLTRVADVMRHGDELPEIDSKVSFTQALVKMTGKQMGMVLAVTEDGILRGIFTDGDLRRAVEAEVDLTHASLASLMTTTPHCVSPEMLAVDALVQMKQKQINHLAVTEQDKLVGALSFHDLLRHGLL